MEGWTTVDLDPASEPDIVASADDLNMIPDWTVEEIRAVDILEHMPYRTVVKTLSEWHRVLKPGALAFIQVPDAGTVMHWWVSRDPRLLQRIPEDMERTFMNGVNWRLMGGQDDAYGDWTFNVHYTLFSAASLTKAVTDAGFRLREINTDTHPNLYCWVSA